MTTKTLKRPTLPAAAGGSTGIAGLMERRQQTIDNARQEWADLVKVAAGVELDEQQVEQLGQVADLLDIDDIERSFNDDVDGWRWCQQVGADIETIRKRDWPTELQRLADEITALEEQRRRLIHQRTVGKVELESIGPMSRELTERQQKHPRLFPN